MKKTIIAAVLLCIIALAQTLAASPINDVLDGYYGNNTPRYDCSFSDLEGYDWAAEAITYLSEYGIVTGDDGKFFPSDLVTRAQFVKIVILGFGLYDAGAECNFTDVPADSWHYPYIASAKKLGIVSGTNDLEFAPDMPLTRQQMTVLVYNAAKYAGVLLDESAGLPLADESEISDYAKEAVSVLKQSGIVSGDENGRFNSHAIATRAEACKLVYSVIISDEFI